MGKTLDECLGAFKIIDIEHKGNVVRLYLGDSDCDDFTGKGWNEAWSMFSAERVDGRFITGHLDMFVPFDREFYYMPIWAACSFHSKEDYKKGLAPLAVVAESDDYLPDFMDMETDEVSPTYDPVKSVPLCRSVPLYLGQRLSVDLVRKLLDLDVWMYGIENVLDSCNGLMGGQSQSE